MNENKKNNDQSVNIYKIFFKYHPTPIYVWQKTDEDLVLINYNAAADNLVDGKMNRFLGIKATELYKDHPDIIEDLNRSFNERITISRDLKYTYLTGDKEKILNVIYSFIPSDMVLVHTEDSTERMRSQQELKNITEKKQTEINLIESEKKFRTLVSRNIKISQKEISSVVGITEVTLRSKYKEFLKKLSFNFI